jgi:hypothetical protein
MKTSFGYLCVDEMIILKCISEETGCKGNGFVWVGMWTCQHNNEVLGSSKAGKFPDHLSFC